MFTSPTYAANPKESYAQLCQQLEALLEGETNLYANLSNASALLRHYFNRINWVGFYLFEEDELILGPFQGLPACVRIPIGKGVCGTAARDRKTIVVDDVSTFPGHITCDAASQSEIVVPMIKNGQLIGVLDIDSPEKNRFSTVDQVGLESFVQSLLKFIDPLS